MKHNAKRSREGSGRGRLGLAVLVATVAAFLLVPVAQAAATTLKVNLAGTGTGTVKDVSEFVDTTPPINCPSTCEGEMSEGEAGVYATPAAGSKFVSWTVNKGEVNGFCDGSAAEKEFVQEALVEAFGHEGAEGACFINGGENAEITATFNSAGPVNPTALTLKKEGTGTGTVVSNPAGIECSTACPEDSGEFEKESLVTLTASAASGSIFKSWKGCVKTIEGTGVKGRKCTVQMSKALTVYSKFEAVSAITATKAGSGYGTVSSSPAGIACGSACTTATALFETSKTVVLKAVPVASTSLFAGWSGSGCSGTGTCEVSASEAHSVTATFNLIPQHTLTLTKSGAGYGTVSSSPAGISCGPTCPSAQASYLETKSVTLKAVPKTGEEFGGWSGSGCSGTGTCTVTMSANRSVTAEFK